MSQSFRVRKRAAEDMGAMPNVPAMMLCPCDIPNIPYASILHGQEAMTRLLRGLEIFYATTDEMYTKAQESLTAWSDRKHMFHRDSAVTWISLTRHRGHPLVATIGRDLVTVIARLIKEGAGV